jgi:HSP20 family molecular chaperone IbpA
VDIFETDKGFVLLADMPGVPPEGLEVVAERNELVIRGRVERPDTTPDYQEFELATYQRAFVLTEDLDVDGIGATLRDGVLRVEIPKSQKVQPKKIPVRAD